MRNNDNFSFSPRYKRDVRYREFLEPKQRELMKYAGMRFVVIRHLTPFHEFIERDGLKRVVRVKLENGMIVDTFPEEVEK